MIKAWRALALALAVLASATLPGVSVMARSAAADLPLLPSPIRVMELGDSTAYGVGASCNTGDRLALRDWLALAGIQAQFVGSQSAGCDPSVARNEGHPGESTAWMVDRVAGWLSANPADLVIITTGVNDLKDPRYMSAEAALGDYVRLVAAIRTASPNTRILATELFVPNGSKGANLARASVEAQRFNTMLAGTLAPYAPYVRVARTGLISTRRSADGLHLDDGGYIQRAWIYLHDPQALGPWLSAKPMPQSDSYFDVLPQWGMS